MDLPRLRKAGGLAGIPQKMNNSAHPAVELTIKGDVERLALNPGDRVVVRVKQILHEEQMRYLRQLTEAQFPDHSVIVLDGGIELNALGPSR